MANKDTSAYSFKCQKVESSIMIYYRCSWVSDRYCANSRLRFPGRHSRDLDEKSARRFCKKHEIQFPE